MTFLKRLRTEGALAGLDLDIDDSWGAAGVLGADFLLNETWLLNLEVRYIGIESDVEVNGVNLGEVEINPLVYSAMVGWRF